MGLVQLPGALDILSGPPPSSADLGDFWYHIWILAYLVAPLVFGVGAWLVGRYGAARMLKKVGLLVLIIIPVTLILRWWGLEVWAWIVVPLVLIGMRRSRPVPEA